MIWFTVKNKLAFLIEILPWLCLNPGVSASDAAKQFGITESQLIDLLQLAVFTGPGQFGGELVDIDFEDSESLFVSDAKGLSRPIKFTKDQSLQIISGLHYLIQIPGLIDNDALTELLNKFMRVTGIINPPIEILPIETLNKNTELLAEAISANQSIEIQYISATTGKISQRLIDPKSFSIEESVRYLRAYCHVALAYRVFRLDRIMEVKKSEKKQLNIDDEISTQKKEVEVQLIVSKHILVQLDQSLLTAVSELADGSFSITIKVHDLNWIAREVLASSGHIKAIGPVELTDLISSKIVKWHELNPVG